ncbi:hypothetical protein DPMN_055449 [Dreissena polymorpha]|uniref:SAM domain-containing protein n=2 Tax=Dreissena polymorpha TaxID=45954 RepID=A0A9D4HQN8_DREPO|nr:hypothetical protein DPMN_055449 [Dreissena polymorpha]
MSTSPNTPKGFSEVQNVTFNWEDYLREDGGTPAPVFCFKQSNEELTNEFEAGQKIEAADPRNLTSTCVATVISTVGLRLRLRLDGSDNSNDFWRLVDSADLHPIGHSEKHGGLLQPPLGFRMNPSSWPSFMQKTLNGAVCAPNSCFKKEPLGPRRNEFKVGMKLEAVDRKNPMLICPATIGAVNGEQVHVRFDGWKGAFDYWCRYDDRDIYPVGWCARTGHPLQPPGQKGNTPAKTSRGRLSDCTMQTLSPGSRNSTPSRTKSPSPIPTSPLVKEEQVAPHESSSVVTVTEPDTSSPSPPTVCVFINHGCNCGPYLHQQRVLQLPSQYGPGVINRVLYDVLKGCMECAFTEKVVYNLIPEGHGRVVISASHGHKSYTKRVIATENAEEFWNLLEKIFEELGCCENLFSTKPLNHVCHKCSRTRSDSEGQQSVSGRSSKSNPRRRWSTESAESLRQSKPPKVRRSYEAEASSTTVDAKPQRPANPADWSIDDVVKHICDTDTALAPHAVLFRKHEIDGKALLLLNSDMMMKYMGLKLGPVLKLCNLIDRLRQWR